MDKIIELVLGVWIVIPIGAFLIGGLLFVAGQWTRTAAAFAELRNRSNNGQ